MKTALRATIQAVQSAEPHSPFLRGNLSIRNKDANIKNAQTNLAQLAPVVTKTTAQAAREAGAIIQLRIAATYVMHQVILLVAQMPVKLATTGMSIKTIMVNRAANIVTQLTAGFQMAIEKVVHRQRAARDITGKGLIATFAPVIILINRTIITLVAHATRVENTK